MGPLPDRATTPVVLPEPGLCSGAQEWGHHSTSCRRRLCPAPPCPYPDLRPTLSGVGSQRPCLGPVPLCDRPASPLPRRPIEGVPGPGQEQQEALLPERGPGRFRPGRGSAAARRTDGRAEPRAPGKAVLLTGSHCARPASLAQRTQPSGQESGAPGLDVLACGCKEVDSPADGPLCGGTACPTRALALATPGLTPRLRLLPPGSPRLPVCPPVRD